MMNPDRQEWPEKQLRRERQLLRAGALLRIRAFLAEWLAERPTSPVEPGVLLDLHETMRLALASLPMESRFIELNEAWLRLESVLHYVEYKHRSPVIQQQGREIRFRRAWGFLGAVLRAEQKHGHPALLKLDWQDELAVGTGSSASQERIPTDRQCTA